MSDVLEPLVHIDGFTMSFGKQTVIDDLSFDIRSGETFGFLGSNGSGKTTTIRALLGIYRATAGVLHINGKPFKPEDGGNLGYLPEERGLYKKESVLDVMVYFGRLKGFNYQAAKDWSIAYLERMDLADKAKVRLDKLSNGEQQKVQLGVTVMNSPELLILDEPTKGFDPVNRRLLMEIIEEQKKSGATVLMVTHQMEEVERLCDRVIFLKNGRAEAYGTVDEVQDHYGEQTIRMKYSGIIPASENYAISRQERNYAELVLNDGADQTVILRDLLADGLQVREFTTGKLSLDEVFIRIYGDQDRFNSLDPAGGGLIMAKHNLRTVVSFEVHRTLAKRRFWVLTLLVPMALGIVFALVYVSNSATKNNITSQRNSKFTFAYTDASGEVNEALVNRFGGTKSANGMQSIADVKVGKLDAFFAYPANPAKQQILVYGVNVGIFENGKYGSVATQILELSARQKIGSPELAALVQGKVKVSTTTYKDGKESGGINGVIPPMLFLLIFYVVIILLGNQMLSSTLEEKENRVTEMILTTVNATTLIIGKIISLFIIGAVQMVVFMLPAIMGYVFFHSSLKLPNFDLSTLVFDPTRMTVGALLLLGGFTLFTGTLVAIGATMPTVKEAGVSFGVMMTLMFIPFYIISLVVSDPHASVVQIFMYFPFSAPITAMLRNAFGSLSLWEAALVISELFLLGFFMLRLAVRLFRYGSIEYTKRVSIRTVLVPRK